MDCPQSALPVIVRMPLFDVPLPKVYVVVTGVALPVESVPWRSCSNVISHSAWKFQPRASALMALADVPTVALPVGGSGAVDDIAGTPD